MSLAPSAEAAGGAGGERRGERLALPIACTPLARDRRHAWTEGMDQHSLAGGAYKSV